MWETASLQHFPSAAKSLEKLCSQDDDVIRRVQDQRQTIAKQLPGLPFFRCVVIGLVRPAQLVRFDVV